MESMKEFSACSGPWVGQSIQEGRRITEAIEMLIQGCQFSGTGSDADGDFVFEGEYDPSDHMIQFTRRYSRVTRPDQSQIGYPFIYVGRWNGDFVSGRWMMGTMPSYGGTFEMWPESEEEFMTESQEFGRQFVEMVHY